MIPLLLVKRFLPHIIGGLVILASLWAIYHSIYQSGYDDAIQEQQNIILQETEKAVAQAKVKWAAELARVEKEHQSELARAKTTDKVKTDIKRVTEYVDRITVKAECDELGRDVVGVLSQASIIVQGALNRSAQSTDTGKPENVLPGTTKNH